MVLISRWGRYEWKEEGNILPVPPATAILTMMAHSLQNCIQLTLTRMRESSGVELLSLYRRIHGSAFGPQF